MNSPLPLFRYFEGSHLFICMTPYSIVSPYSTLFPHIPLGGAIDLIRATCTVDTSTVTGKKAVPAHMKMMSSQVPTKVTAHMEMMRTQVPTAVPAHMQMIRDQVPT